MPEFSINIWLHEQGTLWDMTPCSACYLPLLLFLILKMEAIPSSETLGNFYQNTKHWIPESITFYKHNYRNLKFHLLIDVKLKRIYKLIFFALEAHDYVAFLCYFMDKQVILYTPCVQSCLWRRECIFYRTRKILRLLLSCGTSIPIQCIPFCIRLRNRMLNRYVFPVLCSSYILMWANEPKNETSPLRHTFSMHINSLGAKRAYVTCSRAQ
jgi:hypothetical protein